MIVYKLSIKGMATDLRYTNNPDKDDIVLPDFHELPNIDLLHDIGYLQEICYKIVDSKLNSELLKTDRRILDSLENRRPIDDSLKIERDSIKANAAAEKMQIIKKSRSELIKYKEERTGSIFGSMKGEYILKRR